MNTSQRRLLVAACVLGAVLLHAWNGDWFVNPASNISQWSLIDLGWLAYDGFAFEGLAVPAGLLVAAVFLHLGGRHPATAR